MNQNKHDTKQMHMIHDEYQPVTIYIADFEAILKSWLTVKSAYLHKRQTVEVALTAAA